MSVTETVKEATEAQLPKRSESDNIQGEVEETEERQEPKEKTNHGSGSIDIDHDAQEMVITSLRTQVQDLFSQVNQLNNKLVRSYDRVSDLEDSLHMTTTNFQLSNQKVTQLELEKSQHLSQLTSGLLVEKSHVTAELTRLMEQATAEAAHRGQAENAKEKIERELEELSASLFDEANGMVHEARIARSLSERKVEEAEGRLREAEEAVRVMQSQMQTFIQEKEDDKRKSGVSTPTSTRNAVEGDEKLIKAHLAYQEYLAFLAHLRHLHASNPSGVPPAMATLLQLPFLARLLNEDAEPTLRLDLAPSLNWLSRRSVLSAIHTGQLSVEPISAATLFTLSLESPFITIAGMTPSNLNIMTANFEDLEVSIPCALCGSSIFPNDTNNGTSTETQPTSTPNFASVHISMPSHMTWSATAGSFFRKPSNPLTRALSNTSTVNGVSINGNSTLPNSVPASLATAVPSTTQSVHPITKSKHTSFNIQISQTQIHIFRLALPTSSSSALTSFTLPLSKSSPQPVPPLMSNSSTSGSASSSRPASSASLSSSTTTVASSQPTTFYPLCTSGWCLARLRATCTLWSFIRTGIVEKVWDEEVVVPTPSSGPAPPSRQAFSASATSTPVAESSQSSTEKLSQGRAPPVPPRRRGLWGIASALGEKAASWSENVSKEKRESKGFLTQPSSNAKTMSGASLIKAENSSSDPASSPPLPKRSANRSLPHKGENNPASSTSVVEHTQLTSANTTDSTDPTRSLVYTSPPTKNAHLRNSLSQAVNIPLPESRSGTPSLPVEIKTNGTGAHISDPTPTPSRTASPAPQAATTGAPPPVPRRAAARSKVVVGIISSPSDGAKVDEKPRKDGPDHNSGDGVKQSSDAGLTVTKEETAGEKEGHEKQIETAKPASDTSEGIAGDAKTVSAEQEKLDMAELTDKKTDDDLLRESESGEGNSPISGMNAIIKTAEDKKETQAEELPTEKPSLPDATLHKQLPIEPSSTNDAEASDDTSKVEYVGTSTWEEKTWRELVKIRKDMFYARIGAVM